MNTNFKKYLTFLMIVCMGLYVLPVLARSGSGQGGGGVSGGMRSGGGSKGSVSGGFRSSGNIGRSGSSFSGNKGAISGRSSGNIGRSNSGIRSSGDMGRASGSFRSSSTPTRRDFTSTGGTSRFNSTSNQFNRGSFNSRNFNSGTVQPNSNRFEGRTSQKSFNDSRQFNSNRFEGRNQKSFNNDKFKNDSGRFSSNRFKDGDFHKKSFSHGKHDFDNRHHDGRHHDGHHHDGHHNKHFFVNPFFSYLYFNPFYDSGYFYNPYFYGYPYYYGYGSPYGYGYGDNYPYGYGYGDRYNTYNYYDTSPYQYSTEGREQYSDSAAGQDTQTSPASAPFNEGVKAFRDADYKTAAAKFLESQKLKPQDKILPFAYTQAILAQGDYTAAAAALRDAVSKVNTETEGVFYPRGMYSSEEVLQRQLDNLSLAADTNPQNADLQLLVGYNKLGMGDIDKAEAALKPIVNDNINGPAAGALLKVVDKVRADREANPQQQPQKQTPQRQPQSGGQPQPPTPKSESPSYY